MRVFGNLDFAGAAKGINLPTPTLDQDIATKSYVDSLLTADLDGGTAPSSGVGDFDGGNAASVGGSSSSVVFIGPTAPASPPSVYMWIQTGLGDDGTETTTWVEDGT